MFVKNSRKFESYRHLVYADILEAIVVKNVAARLDVVVV